MAKRHRAALAIQQGACNPSGIAYSIAEACQEVRREADATGSGQPSQDAAVRLMVHQLAYITRAGDHQITGDEYARLMEECERLAQV